MRWKIDRDGSGFDNPWLAMPFLALYAFPWLFYRPSVAELVTAAVALPVFMALFVIGHAKGARHGMPCAFGMAAMGFALVPVTTTAGVFFIFAAALIGRAPPRGSALAILAVLTGAVAVFGLMRQIVLWQWLPVVFLCGLIGYYSYAGAGLKAGRAEAERLAAEAERERIMRDLHDLMGRSLTVIALKAELAGRLLERDPARAGRELEDIRTSARDALQEVRQVVDHARRPSLAGEIRRAEAALETAGVKLTAPDSLPDLPQPAEQALAFIIHEAVTNIIRHAGATAASIELNQANGVINLRVADNGRAILGAEGNGVAGMRSRVAALGGVLSLTQDNGTCLAVTLPIKGDAA